MKNKELEAFKDEFRLIACDGDEWSRAMDAWFEIAGNLYERCERIPNEWYYSSGLSPRDEESYWYPFFGDLETEDLYIIGNFLFRYLQFLKFKGKDY